MGSQPDSQRNRDIRSFVALGDSFTEGLNDLASDGTYRGWADRVADVLAGLTPGFRYANLAIRGKLVRDVIEEQVGPAIAMSPDLVSIAAGGNDILRRADVDELADLFDQGVARLRGAGCRVMIFTGFDPRSQPVIRMLRGRIAAYNMHLRAIADEHDCDLVDLWSMRILRDARLWSDDRLHLTSEGHQLVAHRACTALGLDAPAAPHVTAEPHGAAGAAGSNGAAGHVWIAARRADFRWAKEYALPWLSRRVRHTSTGDEIQPKRPELLPLP